jgi:hypothetical protein
MLTGGVIYSLALSDLLANFASNEDFQLLGGSLNLTICALLLARRTTPPL